MSTPAILVTGGSGQVGGAITALDAIADKVIAAPSRGEFDLADEASIAHWLERDWAAVVNCAAYTAVDRAEAERDAAFAINARAAGLIARACARRDVPLVHLSTDYVFDGAKPAPYIEDDPVGPISVYGESKEAGEQAVRAAGGRHVILRTAWVVSPTGSNFVRTMMRLAGERDLVRIVDDQHGNPTSARDIAAAIAVIVAQLLEGRDAPTGTFHFVNAGEATWRDLAAYIFARMAAAGQPIPRLEAIPTSAYPTPARRPANSRLATGTIESVFGVAPRPWRIAVDEVVDACLAGELVA